MRPRFSGLVFTIALAACGGREADAFWQPGGVYRLALTATGPRLITPESEHYLAPVSDTASLRLVVDSVARDTTFGRVDGDTRHFWVPFRAVGGDRFIASRQRERWRLVVNPQVTDTGLLLEGERSHGRIRGRWHARSPSPPRGSFILDPAP